jgi:hypothetical protein
VGAAIRDCGIDLLMVDRAEAEQCDLVPLGEAKQELRRRFSTVPGVEPGRKRGADEYPAPPPAQG